MPIRRSALCAISLSLFKGKDSQAAAVQEPRSDETGSAFWVVQPQLI